MKSLATVCLLVCLAVPQLASAQGAGTIGGAVLLKEALDDFGKQIDSSVARAISGGDMLALRVGSQLDWLIANLRVILKDELDTRFDKLDDEVTRVLEELGADVDKVVKGFDTIARQSTLLSLDLQSYIESLPFVSDRYVLKQIDGYSQAIRERDMDGDGKPDGFYEFALIGNAFGIGYETEIAVAGVPVPPSDQSIPRQYITRFTVPATVLNVSFENTTVARVPFSLRSYEVRNAKWYEKLFGKGAVIKTERFSHDGKLVLLPRYPVQYKLTEHSVVPKWVDANDRLNDYTICPRTGKSGNCNPCTCTLNKTVNQQFSGIGDSKSWHAKPPSFGNQDWIGSATINGNTLKRTFNHCIHDVNRRLDCSVEYRNLVGSDEDASRSFTNDLSEEKPGGAITFLQYGATQAKLSNAYRSFTLILTFFTGQTATLTPVASNQFGARVKIENKSDYKRLTLTIDDPSSVLA